jgi:hypothetical protein
VAALQRAEGEQGARAEQAKLAAVEWRETAKLRAQAMVSAVELEQREIARDAAGAGVAAAGGGVGEARAAIAQAEAQIRQLKAAKSDLSVVAPRRWPGGIPHCGAGRDAAAGRARGVAGEPARCLSHHLFARGRCRAPAAGRRGADHA